MRSVVGLIAIVFFLACDNRFEYVLPVNDPRMVVNFISSNSEPWRGTLTLSTPILELPDFKGVPGATIKIYEDGNLVETLNGVAYDPRQSRDAATLSRPTPGRTYSIEAVSGQYKTATGTYVQPLPVPIEKFEVELVTDPEIYHSDGIEFRVTFVDPPGENFYIVEAVGGWDSLSLRGQDYQLIFTDPAYKYENKYTYRPPSFDDTYFEGQRVTMAFRGYAQLDTLGSGPNRESWYDYHWVTLKNVSKAYYRYLETVDLRQETFGDPYAQPVKVATNVKNGFGVVGGWTRTAKGKPFAY